MKQFLVLFGLFLVLAVALALPLDPAHPHLDTFKSGGVSVLDHEGPKKRVARDFERDDERFGRFAGLSNRDYGYHGDADGAFQNEFEDVGSNFDADGSAGANSAIGAGGFVF